MRVFASGSTALTLTSNKDHKEVVRHLLDKGADVNAADNNGKQDKGRGARHAFW